jgi:S-adenosyl methyltransferase
MANVAGVNDVLLGGKGTSVVDEQAACELLRLLPDAVMAAYQKRNFLGRAVRFLSGQAGIRQFIDIGTGLTAPRSLHKLAWQAAPDARVLYVDCDPAVVSHAQELLARDGQAATIHGDLRDPGRILGDPALRALINLDEPVAILLAAVMHFTEDGEEPYRIVDTIKRAVVPGSYLALSHFSGDDIPPDVTQRVRALYEGSTAPLTQRSRQEIALFLDGLEIIPPGVVNGSAWRAGYAEPDPRRTIFYAGLGKKR